MNVSRRTVLRGATMAGVAATLGGTPSVPAFGSPGRRVAVLGGGMAGLAAAHELIERGFDVTVYESTALGGKARSIPVPGSGTMGRADLPGEHGFRFFPGFYHNVPDTMSRIPLPGKGNSVTDNLVSLNGALISRNGGRADIDLAIPTNPATQPLDPNSLRDTIIGIVQQFGALPPQDVALFADRLLVYMTSSPQRREGQWENVAFWDFMRAENRSKEYQVALVRFMTRGLIALKERVANTRTVGAMGEAFILAFLGQGTNGQSPARMLNGPTSETWIDPWVRYLTERGVRFQIGQTVRSLEMSGGRISSATVTGPSGSAPITADWFICAVPMERARQLLSAEILNHAPELAGMSRLRTDWMNGVQFYLRETPPIKAGTQLFLDSPWEITSVLDSTLWDRDIPAQYGDGAARDILSLDVSDWDTPGILYGKPARECTIEQVFAECWAQLRDGLHDTGRSILPDGIRHSSFLDPGIQESAGGLTNATPLFVNTVGSYQYRPESATSIPNLFLAGDYVRTDINLATMEGANESGRQAVNALLDAAGIAGDRVPIQTLYQPPEFEPLKRIDAMRYATGQPNLFDLPA